MYVSGSNVSKTAALLGKRLEVKKGALTFMMTTLPDAHFFPTDAVRVGMHPMANEKEEQKI